MVVTSYILSDVTEFRHAPHGLGLNSIVWELNIQGFSAGVHRSEGMPQPVDLEDAEAVKQAVEGMCTKQLLSLRCFLLALVRVLRVV